MKGEMYLLLAIMKNSYLNLALLMSYDSMNDIQRNVKNQSKYAPKICYCTNICENMT